MRIVRAAEVDELSAQMPEAGGIAPAWWEGPHDADRLSAGLVNLAPGAATPPHVHIGGQVMVVTAGRGWVEAHGERVELRPGDVVIAPAGELHVHGAAPDSPFAHLNVTAAGYRFPEAALPDPPA